jgi:putative endonuclease
MIPPPEPLGRSGEELTAQWLVQNRFTIVAQNFHIRGGEVDIIAQKEERLHFIEVKTSRCYHNDERDAAYWISPLKLSRIVKTAEEYIVSNGSMEWPWQIDAVLCRIDLTSGGYHIEYFPNITV